MDAYKQPFDDLMGQIRAMKKRSDKYEAEERAEGNIDEAGTHLRVSCVLKELERLGLAFEERAKSRQNVDVLAPPTDDTTNL